MKKRNSVITTVPECMASCGSMGSPLNNANARTTTETYEVNKRAFRAANISLNRIVDRFKRTGALIEEGP